MIGDELLTDILFGNLNKMATVWVTKYKDGYSEQKHDDSPLYKMETKYAFRMLK